MNCSNALLEFFSVRAVNTCSHPCSLAGVNRGYGLGSMGAPAFFLKTGKAAPVPTPFFVTHHERGSGHSRYREDTWSASLRHANHIFLGHHASFS